MKASTITIKTLFDNVSLTDKTACQSLWGFSCYIETPNSNILFDTGSNGRILLENMRVKDIDISSIDTIFISHSHWDHIGGIDSIVELNSNVRVIVSSHVSKNFIKDYDKLTKGVTLVKDEITKISSDIHSSGTIGSHLEHSLIIESDDGLIIISGCSHSGIENIITHSSSHFSKRVLLALGGFHLLEKSEDDIMKLINFFDKIGVKYIAPSHCTGKKAREMFKKHMKCGYIGSELGITITFDDSANLNSTF